MSVVVNAPLGGTMPGAARPDRLGIAQLQGPLSLSLLHQRFAAQEARTVTAEAGRGSPLKEACDTFAAAFTAQRGHAEPLLQLVHKRLDQSGVPVDQVDLASDWTHAWCDVRLVSQLAIGLGNEHPFENGLTLHHLVGAPMIPGATLKGLTRAWRGLDGADTEATNQRFGRESEDRRTMHAGQLIVLDSLPLTWPALAVDIINNHLPAYYQGRGNPGAVPKESPVPVFLLVVAPGTRFRLRVGATPTAPDRATIVRETLTELVDALSLIAVGARKANGYGVFEA